MLKVGDKVKVKQGLENDPTHAGIVGTIKEIRATPPENGVEFDPKEVLSWYGEADLDVQP